jgi:membrane-bound lytic murein transglycosylase B
MIWRRSSGFSGRPGAPARHSQPSRRSARRPPTTGEGYARDGDGDGLADVWNPADAIAGAARLLRANGAPANYRRALFAYGAGRRHLDPALTRAELAVDPRLEAERFREEPKRAALVADRNEDRPVTVAAIPL